MTDKTLGAYQRTTPDPDETTGEALARLQAEIAGLEEEAARDDALARLDVLGDDGTALRCAVMIAQAGAGVDTVAEFCEQVARGQDVNVADRAEKAEQRAALWKETSRRAIRWRNYFRDVRDDLLRAHLVLQEELGAETARLAESRPLTPDAITDEMVERAFRATIPHPAASVSEAVIREMLTAALTEPPARPEGAEDIEAAFGTWERSEYLHAALDEDDLRSIANHIAEEMNR